MHFHHLHSSKLFILLFRVAIPAPPNFHGVKWPANHPVSRFVAHMNREARRIGMPSTFFCNPHGLTTGQDYSCARDLAILSYRAFQIDLLREMSSLPAYSCNIPSPYNFEGGNSGNGPCRQRKVEWITTNQILQDESIFCRYWRRELQKNPPQKPFSQARNYESIDFACEYGKTGVTDEAKGCFVASFRSNFLQRSFTVIVLGSDDKMGGRWKPEEKIICSHSVAL
jgi:D-alanyl-D-alanine carboxypeptidase